MTRDELVIEEMCIRATQEKMDDAFRDAVQRAIRTAASSCRPRFPKCRALGDRRSSWLSNFPASSRLRGVLFYPPFPDLFRRNPSGQVLSLRKATQRCETGS